MTLMYKLLLIKLVFQKMVNLIIRIFLKKVSFNFNFFICNLDKKSANEETKQSQKEMDKKSLKNEKD